MAEGLESPHFPLSPPCGALHLTFKRRNREVPILPVESLDDLPIEALAKLCEESYIERMYVIGSFARGEQRPDSDIDFLIRRTNEKKKISVMHAFPRKLAKLVGRDVDVVTESILENRVFAKEFEEVGQLVYERR